MIRPTFIRPRLTSLAITILLVGLVAFTSMSVDLYLPALPAIAHALHTDAARTQLTMGAFAFGMGTAQLIHGPLSDRFGRRPVLLWGIAIYFAASVICMFAPTVEVLIAGRYLQAVGACAAQVIARAIVRDVYEREQAARMLSLMMAAFTLSPLIAPLVGGYLQAVFGWQADFVGMALFGGIMLAATWLMLEESNLHLDMHAARIGKALSIYADLLKSGEFRAHMLIQGCLMGGTFAFLSASPFLFVEVLGGKAEHFGYFFAIAVIGYLIGNLATVRLVRRWGSPRLMGLGTLIGVSGGISGALLALFHIETFASVSLPMSFVMIGHGMVMPNNIAEALTPYPRVAGSAAALLGSVQILFPVFSGWFVVAMANGTTQPMYLYIAFMWIVAALTTYRKKFSRQTA